MQADELRALQTPLKDRYKQRSRQRPANVDGTWRTAQDKVTCVVKSPRGPIEAGLHPSTGGTGEFACSGDMFSKPLLAASA